MGAVYLAANTKAFDRACVVKEVIEYYDRYDPAERAKAMRQFECEARTLAALKHPGIPDIYAYFTEDGRNYLVMEYIEGDDLSKGLNGASESDTPSGPPLAETALPAEDVVRYAIQICDVLAYLGQCQPPVMHNDIKPGNIILDENRGRAVLVDFGTVQSRYTRAATGKTDRQRPNAYGTMGYAAPELYEGKSEPRSDVYALAATVYHLLTHDDPRAHPFQFPFLDRISEPLREILAAALEVEVDDRIDALEFKSKLQHTLAPLQASVQLAKKASPRRRLVKARAGRGRAGKQQKARRQTVKLWPPFGRASVEVTPTQIALGRMSAEEMYTDARTLTVRNRSKAEIQCSLEGMPSWLTAAPKNLTCGPGETQQVSLRGRAMGLLVYERLLSTTVQVVVDERSYPIRVSMRPPPSRRRRRKKIIRLAAVGVASLTLAGLVTWFALVVLPTL
jgi:serine/threonine protein kinase